MKRGPIIQQDLLNRNSKNLLPVCEVAHIIVQKIHIVFLWNKSNTIVKFEMYIRP